MIEFGITKIVLTSCVPISNNDHSVLCNGMHFIFRGYKFECYFLQALLITFTLKVSKLCNKKMKYDQMFDIGNIHYYGQG